MKRVHAIGTGILGVALSASAVLAAAPIAPSEAASTIPTSASAPGDPDDDHGAAVSVVARDHTQVGGDHDNHGGAVSAAAHASKPDADAPETPDADAPSHDTGKAGDNHGAAVSTVAKDQTQVGGKHDNHGGAVSAAAHSGKGPQDHAPGHHHGHD